MKKLSLNRHKKSNEQTKISNFFDVFKTPEAQKVHVKDMIENTPEENRKSKLSRLRKQSSKLFGTASTTSLISGNLDKKVTTVHSPPKKRPLTPDDK